MKPFLFILYLLSFSSFSQKLTIAVSSSAQFALAEIVGEFKKEKPAEIDLIVGSSGKLTNQILQGAPFHLFFSADLEYPQYLFDKGFSNSKPIVYGYGSIVLWTKKEIPLSSDLSILKSSAVKRIAVANPEVAPYGKQTLNLLQTKGIYEEIKGKIIFGESVSQVSQFITSGNVDFGFSAKSIVSSPGMKGVGKWIEIDHKYYFPIAQGAVILKRGSEEVGELAAAFLSFVVSDRGKAILIKNGIDIKIKKGGE